MMMMEELFITADVKRNSSHGDGLYEDECAGLIKVYLSQLSTINHNNQQCDTVKLTFKCRDR